MIARRARCLEALRFLRYVRKVLEEKGEDAAAAAAAVAAGHGWDWVEENCRCVFDLLGAVPLIRSLDPVFRRRLLWMLDLANRQEGQILFRQGDKQEALWLILDGRIGVRSTDKQGVVHHTGEFNSGHVENLNRVVRVWRADHGFVGWSERVGSTDGKSPQLSQTPPSTQVVGSILPEKRLATVICLEQCTLLQLDRATFLQALNDPEAQRAVVKKNFFRSVSLFKGLGERDLDRLVSVFHHTTLEAGDVLCREGERVDYLYLVQRGNLRLLKAFVPLPDDDDDDNDDDDDGGGGSADGDDGVPARQRRRAEDKAGSELESNTETETESERIGSNAAQRRERTHEHEQEKQQEPRHQRQQQQEHRQQRAEAPRRGVARKSLSATSNENANIANGDSCRRSSGPGAQQALPSSASPSPSSPPMRVRYFDLGVVGRREFIGEGGFTSAAFAGAGALKAAGGMVGEDVRDGGSMKGRRLEGARPGSAAAGEEDGPGGARVRRSVWSSCHKNRGVVVSRIGGDYLVSAFAEGRVDIFAAKVCHLLPLQSAALKLCWIEGCEAHKMKEREWKADALAAKLRKQIVWERTKRAIVMDSIRIGVLEKRMAMAVSRAERAERGRGVENSRRGNNGSGARTNSNAAAVAELPQSHEAGG
ncbi:unnamed protein product [Ectocarpus sp. CCAP 1310/34]|nr:unnamed protein product [Ectocarpus sp. CCAP 1310/34]